MHVKYLITVMYLCNEGLLTFTTEDKSDVNDSYFNVSQ